MITIKSKDPGLRLYPDDLLFWDHNGRHYCLRCTQGEPMNPRDDDNVATMFCSHRRYSLGDRMETNINTSGEFWGWLVSKYVPQKDLLQLIKSGKMPGYTGPEDNEDPSDDDLLDGLFIRIEDEEDFALAQTLLKDRVAWLPLWLYDHSGITMSCGSRTYPYNDRWDSGCVGFIFVPKEKAIRNLTVKTPDPTSGSGVKYVMCDESNWEEAAIQCMQQEVQTYDQYLTGDVYDYEIYSRPADSKDQSEYADSWEEEDGLNSCYGSDMTVSGALSDIGFGLKETVESGQYKTGTAKTETYVRLRLVEG